MDESTIRQLLDINRKFYSQFASDFSATRSSGGINLTHILPYLSEGVKLLDLGCGNGRLAQRLDSEKFSLTYFGLDAAAGLVERAQTVQFKRLKATFRVGDVTQRDWTRLVPAAPFDLVVALAVLHHIPSGELRTQVLTDVRGLLKPKCKLLVTNWKFDENARLSKKLIPWSTAGIDESALEAGDALIAWRRGGTGCRYVHLISPEEMEGLARKAGFNVEKQFYADAGMNLYSVLSVL